MKPQSLKSLEVTNLKRVQFARMVVNSPSIEISSDGKNAQGKTSLMAALDLITNGNRSVNGKKALNEYQEKLYCQNPNKQHFWINS